MKAIDCVRLASRYLGDARMDECLEKYEEDESFQFGDEEKKLIKNYLGALNVAVDTIASEEITLSMVDKVVSNADGKVSYVDFSERLLEVLEVVDKKADAFVDFYALPFGIYLPKANREYLVRYKYLPKKVEGFDEEIVLSPFVLPSVIAKLMVSDILISKNSYDEASVWRGEYKRDISYSLSKRKGKVMPVRNLI